jgi:hypothetical protein
MPRVGVVTCELCHRREGDLSVSYAERATPVICRWSVCRVSPPTDWAGSCLMTRWTLPRLVSSKLQESHSLGVTSSTLYTLNRAVH